MNRLLVSSLLLGLVGNAAQGAALLPHRAYYDLSPARVDQGSGISAIRGKLAFEIQGSTCEGFTINHRMATRVTFIEGGTQVTDSQASNYESGDGLQLDVTHKQVVDGNPFSETRVKVTKLAIGEKGVGEITKPKLRSIETEAAAMFPTQHQLILLEKAKAGENRDVSLVYDGTEEEKHFKVVSFIGPERKPSADTTALTADARSVLSTGKAWAVTTSYYKTDDNADDAPAYQASFVMLENGVTTDLVLDYGSYALSGKLTKLDVLKQSDCN